MIDSLRVALFGASGGIGRALLRTLIADSRVGHIFAGTRNIVSLSQSRVTPFSFDLTDEASIVAASALVSAQPPLDLIIIATGELRNPEKGWRMQDADAYARAFAINATGPALIGKHFLPLLHRNRRAVFAALSAKVGSISDNRLGGWHAYRASKAALNMIVRNFSLELAVRNPLGIAVALHPGTVETALSRPFTRNTNPQQIQSAGSAAAHILSLIDSVTPADNGGFFAWDGTRLPY